nr:hypothetical protein BaRGS_019785 [Batillaria attramentaria]
MVAMFAAGNFLAMPDFTGRVELLGNAEMLLSSVVLGDSGNYSVEVGTINTESVLRKFDQVVGVEVSVCVCVCVLDCAFFCVV